MKNTIYILFIAIIFNSCQTKDAKPSTEISKEKNFNTSTKSQTNTDAQVFRFPQTDNINDNTDHLVSLFVRRIFEDSNGHLWFGTNGDGVAQFNGEELEYFNSTNGFNAQAVRGIVEDKHHHIYFATNNGLIVYNGKQFKQFTETDGLDGNDIWSIYLDHNNLLWLGTINGVSTFKDNHFKSFNLPETTPDYNRGVTSSKIVHAIMQDSKSQMWFATNNGAYIYNGKTLKNISEKDGLSNNAVNDILEDNSGNIWFATHHKGISVYNGESFNKIDTNTVKGSEVWSLFKDKTGAIWFPVEGYGVYKFNGERFINYHKNEGLTSNAIQDIFQDRKGKFWFGGHLGLFSYNGTRFYSIAKDGPWK